ncbi:MAG: hypothetical protein P8L77_02335 [Gammaproteobacteria bacterium]|nr:hypothetical protein [Gammaproteobacteria bacterium]
MKLTIETLNRAYTEKKKQENRSKWFTKVIDVLAMINNIIAKIIPFPTFFTHQNYYKLKVINDGFSDLEDFWKYGYKNQTSKHIKFVIDEMKKFESSMTNKQLERFEQLNKFSNILPKAQSKEEASPGNKAEDTLFTSSSHSIKPTEQTAADTDKDVSIEPIDLKPVYNLELPWYLIPGLNTKKDEVELDDLLSWFQKTKQAKRATIKYSSDNNRKRIHKFDQLIQIAPYIREALDLFCDIMRKPKHGQGMLDVNIQQKLGGIKQNSPELYEFFFEPYDTQKDIFIAHPLIFKAFRIALDNKNNNKFIADLVTSLSFLNKLLPLSPPTTFDSETNFIEDLNLNNDINLLMGAMFGNYADFDLCAKKYLREGNLDVSDLRAGNNKDEIEDYLKISFLEYTGSKETIEQTYQKIPQFQQIMLTHKHDTSYNSDDRVEELDSEYNKENNQQFNGASTQKRGQLQNASLYSPEKTIQLRGSDPNIWEKTPTR